MSEVQVKKCEWCGRILPVTEFYRDKNSKDGYHVKCKECYNSYRSNNTHKINGLRKYKKEAIKAAKELYYGEDVIEKIKEAKTENQIRNIMEEARKSFWEDME